MKIVKRLVPIYIIMVYCIAVLSGCSVPGNYEGKDLVDRAKKLHTELEAAHITITDEISGVVVQEITYRFAGDVMQYMYIGRDAETGEEYYEFNNGTELDTWRTGDTAWSFVAKGSEGYYNYSRAKRHYFADGELLLNDYASAVKTAKIRSEVGEAKRVIVSYDDSKISQNEQMTGVTDYCQEYLLSVHREGVCSGLTVSYFLNGKEQRFMIAVQECDLSVPIERAKPPALTEYTQ
jgi:hypothetical protein